MDRGILPARILEWFPFLSPGDFPDSRIETISPTLTGGFFTRAAQYSSLNLNLFILILNLNLNLKLLIQYSLQAAQEVGILCIYTI